MFCLLGDKNKIYGLLCFAITNQKPKIDSFGHRIETYQVVEQRKRHQTSLKKELLSSHLEIKDENEPDQDEEMKTMKDQRSYHNYKEIYKKIHKN